jgi:hypothetical protein
MPLYASFTQSVLVRIANKMGFQKRTYIVSKSCGSAVGIATGYDTGRSRGHGSSPGRVKNFHFSISSKAVLGPNPIKWVPRALSVCVKRPGCKADHSPPTSAERSRKHGSIQSQGKLYVFNIHKKLRGLSLRGNYTDRATAK